MIEPTTYLFDLFISYCEADKLWVWHTLLPRLEGVGVKVCIDSRDFQLGVPVTANIEWAVESSRRILLVLTPDWVSNEWADFEATLTQTSDPAGRRRRLLPVLLKSCDPPRRLSGLTFADLRNIKEFEQQFERLITSIQQDVPPTNSFSRGAELSSFVVGPPIQHPRLFFGRNDILIRVFNLIRRSPLQNAAIVGPKRSGKTSLLNYLQTITITPKQELRPNQQQNWIPQPQRYRWVFVDFLDPRTSRRESLLRFLSVNLALPQINSYTLENFLDLARGRLKVPTIILFDEIGVALQRYPELDNSFWEGLRSLASSRDGINLSFILSAHEAPEQLATKNSFGSPFFNIFGYTATLGPLLEEEAHDLIGSSPIPFSAEDRSWIMERTRRWPILLQIFCRERLLALENSDNTDTWREESIRQSLSFRHLLEDE